MTAESGSGVDATSACITTAWKGFRKLLPIITNRGNLLRSSGNIFSVCIRKSLLYCCKTWPTSSESIRRLTSADNGMVRWICGVWIEQQIRTQELYENFDIVRVPEEIVWPRLTWPTCCRTGRMAKGNYVKKNNCKECDPSEVDKYYKRWER